MKKEFITVRLSSDQKITGMRASSEQLKIVNGEVDGKCGVDPVLARFSLANFKENKDGKPAVSVIAKAYATAKLTDFINFEPQLWGCPLIVSRAGRQALESFTLPSHEFYPVIVNKKEVPYNKEFFLFNIPWLGDEYIDFSESVFSTGSELMGDFETVRLASSSEYQPMYSGKPLHIKEIRLSNLFDPGLDVFYLNAGTNLYFSRQLFDHIRAEKLTGLNLDDGLPRAYVLL